MSSQALSPEVAKPLTAGILLILQYWLSRVRVITLETRNKQAQFGITGAAAAAHSSRHTAAPPILGATNHRKHAICCHCYPRIHRTLRQLTGPPRNIYNSYMKQNVPGISKERRKMRETRQPCVRGLCLCSSREFVK